MSDAVASALIERIVAALATVYDPELDEPITALRFISAVRADGHGDVEVRLRLPTPQCAPNFAFLMGADARRAVVQVTGVRAVRIILEDHYTGEEINVALAAGAGFTGAFPGETDDDDLEPLRALFTAKALIGRQATLCEQMLASGWSEADVVAATVSDLPPDWPTPRVLELRRMLGLPDGPDSAAFLQPGGEPVDLAGLTRWRRAARLVALSLEANGGMCRDLLAARHHLTSEPEPEEVLR
jgi:metal-sulfur cluster biosynthetic enzyme